MQSHLNERNDVLLVCLNMNTRIRTIYTNLNMNLTILELISK
jgi:hypothetical protein